MVLRYKIEPLDQETYQAGLNRIHSDAVTAVIAEYSVNPLPSLGEQELPRQTRVVLTQLGSRWCSCLNFYSDRIYTYFIA